MMVFGNENWILREFIPRGFFQDVPLKKIGHFFGNLTLTWKTRSWYNGSGEGRTGSNPWFPLFLSKEKKEVLNLLFTVRIPFYVGYKSALRLWTWKIIRATLIISENILRK